MLAEINMHATYLASLLLAIFCNSILIFFLHNRTQRPITIVSFILFLFSINIWAGPYFIINAFSLSPLQFSVLNRIAALGYIMIPVSFFIFSLAFTVHFRILRSFLFWIFLLTPALIFLFMAWTTDLIGVNDKASIIKYSWGYETPAGKYFPTFLLWFDSVMLIAITMIIITYKTTRDAIRKKQALFVIIAVFFPLVIGTVTNGLLPIFSLYVFPAAIPLTSIMATIIVFAIIKYGLFEVSPFSILSSLEHGIITVDNKGNILQMNTVAERILALKANKIIGKKVETIIVMHDNNGKDINIERKYILPALEKGKKTLVDLYVPSARNSHSYPFSVSVSPIYSQRSIIGASIIFRDIRKEKQREQNKDDFISMISHELKTPITSIKAYNQILMKQLENKSKQKQLVMKVDEQLDRLNRLIKDFLDMSRVQSGKLKMEKELFKLDDLVIEVVDHLHMVHKNRKIIIKGRTKGFVFADKDRIAQVLINLITNALKYSEKNKKVIISILNERQFITVAIRDYGIGVPAEYHRKIFDRLYQLNKGEKQNSGLGFGLFISSNIIKAHGGKIWLESEDGKGSTFYFSLPIE